MSCREEVSFHPSEMISSINSSSLAILSPKLGDIWYINKSYEIRWIPSTKTREVTIHLYRKYILKKVISSRTENDGYYIYRVSPDLQTSNLYRIKIINPKDTNDFAYSQYFSIRE